MSSKPVVITLGLNDAPFQRGIEGARQKMLLLQKTAENFGHGTVSSMQASSAALRTLEGGLTNNLRAAERMLSLLPGVGAALQGAFPVVGALALVGVLGEAVERLGNFTAKLKDIPGNPFSSVVNSAKLSNDALAITNDRLQLEIQKLEHAPQNRLALALDQMREASDKLYDSLEKSNKAFDEAMSKGKVGTIKGTVRNMTPTDDADANIGRARAIVQKVYDDHQTTIDDAERSGDPANVKQAREALMNDLQGAYQKQDQLLQFGLDQALHQQKLFTDGYSRGSDPSAVIQRYRGALATSSQDQLRVGGEYGNSLLTGQKDSAQDANDAAEVQKEGDRKRLQAMQDSLEQTRAQYGMNIIAERSYWQQRESAFTAGSDAYREVVNKVAGLEIQMQRQQQESLKAARASEGRDDQESFRVMERMSAAMSEVMRKEAEDVLHTGERWKQYNELKAKSAEIDAANAAAMDRARVAIGLATGEISRLDAAQQIADAHARKFAQDLAALQAERQSISSDSSLTDVQRDTALQQNSNATSVLRGQYDVQRAEDNANISGNTQAGQYRTNFNQMLQDFNDFAANLSRVMEQTVDGLNTDLAKLITGQGSKADFGKTLQQAGEGMVKSSLQKLEGAGLQAAGFGKPDGTAGNPIYTRDAGGKGVAGVLGNGQQQDDGSNGKGGGGGFWSRLLQGFGVLPKSSNQAAQNAGGGGGGGGDDDDDGDGSGDGLFQGFFAGGGSVSSGRPLILGERGPELFLPRSAGQIIPNHMLHGYDRAELSRYSPAARAANRAGDAGGDVHHHYNIDARGATDPAAVEAAVRRAMPQAVAASVQVQHQHAMRRPGGR